MIEVSEEAQARADVWKYIFGYVKTIVVKSAVELEIPDVLEKHGTPISLSELSSLVGCPPDPLHRIMRFLAHQGVFRATSSPSSSHVFYYAKTPLSRLFTRENMGPFMLLQLSGQFGGISAEALRTGKSPVLKKVEIKGEDIWTNPALYGQMKVFSDAMAAHAKVAVSAIINNYPEVFKGIGSSVDVGGRHGMALGLLVKAFPWVRGISFDLPQVVSQAPPLDGVEFVGGDMFESVPKADSVMLMKILHDWSDEKCIDILKKCKEAVPADTGKVLIVDAIIDEEGEGDEYADARLASDMVMMAVTANGKERTYGEWANLLKAAGFSRHTVKNIKTIESVIEAYP